MSIRHLQLEHITQDDLQNLIENEVSESKEIEYKEQLPGSSTEAKCEFLADVTSLANCMGGDIIYGVPERRDEQNRPTGLPDRLQGIPLTNFDEKKLRLENLVRDGIEPRITGLSFKKIGLNRSASALIVRIPKSWASPHMVKYRGPSRFYSRNSSGKYPLDVGEIRNAFLQSEVLADKLRDFRATRLAQIISNTGPVELSGQGIIVLHLVPFQSFDVGMRFDLTPLGNSPSKLEPMYASGWNNRYNFEGILGYSPLPGSNQASGYLQVFRTGIIEAVDTLMLDSSTDGLHVPSIAYEQTILSATARYLELQRELDVDPPVALMLSLLSVQGYVMGMSPLKSLGRRPSPIDRDSLILPETIIEDYSWDVGRALKPAFDAVWNAAGWPGSLNYDENGRWRPYKPL